MNFRLFFNKESNQATLSEKELISGAVHKLNALLRAVKTILSYFTFVLVYFHMKEIRPVYNLIKTLYPI